MTRGEEPTSAIGEDPELWRYIEHLQSHLATSANLSWHDGWNTERALSRGRRRSLKGASQVRNGRAAFRAFENKLRTLPPRTRFDEPFSRLIFESVLKNALRFLEQADLKPRLPILLADSPEIGPSPSSVPSTDSHILLAGAGLYSFCNYWTKTFLPIIVRLPKVPHAVDLTKDAIAANFSRHSGLVRRATRLAAFHGLVGTTVGFGEMHISKNLHNVRDLVLRSMESFAIGHELGHFIWSEMRDGLAASTRGSSEAHAEEYFCDFVGLGICMGTRSSELDLFARHGAPPVFFFYAIEMARRIRALVGGQAEMAVSETHPNPLDRVQRLRLSLQFLSSTNTKWTEDALRLFDEVVAVCEALMDAVTSHVTMVVTILRDSDDPSRR